MWGWKYGLLPHRYVWERDWCPKCDGPFLLLILCLKEEGGWGKTTIPPSPRGNVWFILAKALNQSALCLSMASPQAPFHRCLVGIPVDDPQVIVTKAHGRKPQVSCNTSMVSCMDNFNTWDNRLPLAPSEQQKLEILGLIKANVCIYFNYRQLGKKYNSDPYYKMTQDVSPSQLLYHSSSFPCNQTVISNGSVYYAPSDSLPCKLPRGIFLVCGDVLGLLCLRE